jgi:hypothetical protein
MNQSFTSSGKGSGQDAINALTLSDGKSKSMNKNKITNVSLKTAEGLPPTGLVKTAENQLVRELSARSKIQEARAIDALSQAGMSQVYAKKKKNRGSRPQNRGFISQPTTEDRRAPKNRGFISWPKQQEIATKETPKEASIPSQASQASQGEGLIAEATEEVDKATEATASFSSYEM